MNDRGVLDVSGRGRVDDRGMLDVSGRGRVDDQGMLNVSGRGMLGVRVNMPMGVPGHSELVGARDGYRNIKLFGQNKSRTIQHAHRVTR